MNCLSEVAVSNLRNKAIAAKKNSLQKVQSSYSIPIDPKARELLARIIIDEALETVHALGFHASVYSPGYGEGKHICNLFSNPPKELDIFEIIDGCCDTTYVAIGCMASMGVPDIPHIVEVCRANDDKFPNGEAIVNEWGKYLKPEGWKGPDHEMVMKKYYGLGMNMSLLSESLAKGSEKNGT